MQPTYAQVITQISVKSLERVFTYRIPKNMSQRISVGSVVEIPFGAGNRMVRGYVLGFTDHIDFEISKIKEIHQIYDKVGIESEMISLAMWMKKRYATTLQTALKVMLPSRPDVLPKHESYVQCLLTKEQLSHKIEQWSNDKRLTSRVRALEVLMDSPYIKQKAFMEAADIGKHVINTLIKYNVVTIAKEELMRLPYDVEDYEVTTNLGLNDEQQNAFKLIGKALDEKSRDIFLLHGITGSGKTEVYMQVIEKALAKNQTAIVLIPEIGLTPQMVKRFVERFGDIVGVMHSRLSQGERFDQWQMAKEGKIKVMIGPRSAIFAPLVDIGVIIVDEEHEVTYKSEMPPKYHAREVAIYRAYYHQCPVVLGSATPLVESYYKALEGKYRLLELPRKAKATNELLVKTVDLRQELIEGNKSILSNELKVAIEECLEKKEQIILFINRRGHSNFVSCRKCGYVLKCTKCDVSYNYHKYTDSLLCHYCGDRLPMVKKCPNCQSEHIRSFGIGTQKVEDHIRKVFPKARVLRMDFDTTSGKHGHQEILGQFGDHEADILIGTQMVAKGHHFDNVTLVGVLAADMSLYVNDFRASERTFQLITQVTGRSGRGHKQGKAIIQTYSPSHYSVVAAKEQDYKQFYKNEIAYRELMSYAPFANMMTVLLTSIDEKYIIQLSYKIHDRLAVYGKEKDMTMLGPSPATLSKIKNNYRRVIYIKSQDYKFLAQLATALYDIMKQEDKRQIGSIQIDINPMMTY